jgi:hypothetical protein
MRFLASELQFYTNIRINHRHEADSVSWHSASRFNGVSRVGASTGWIRFVHRPSRARAGGLQTAFDRWRCIRDDAGAFRVVYVAKFDEAVYVLPAFQKKSRKTSQADIDLATKRYKLIGERS